MDEGGCSQVSGTLGIVASAKSSLRPEEDFAKSSSSIESMPAYDVRKARQSHKKKVKREKIDTTKLGRTLHDVGAPRVVCGVHVQCCFSAESHTYDLQ